MVVLFMIAMFLIFLIGDYFVQKKQATQLKVSEDVLPVFNLELSDFFLPNGIFVANNHLKAQLTSAGEIKLGIDNFISSAMGKIDKIILPEINSIINKGDTLLTLVQGDHTTEIKSFSNGTVTDINARYASSSSYLNSDNVAKAWAITFTPDQLSTTLRMLKVGQEAKEWMKNEINRFKEFLNEATSSPSTAIVLQDGGLPTFGVLQNLDSGAWKKFEKEFLT